MAAIKKSQSNKSEDQLIDAWKIARKSTWLTKKKPKVIGEKKDESCEVPPPKESDRHQKARQDGRAGSVTERRAVLGEIVVLS